LKTLCKYTGEDDGTFWISFNDYYNYFNAIFCNKVEEWNEIWLPGKFIWVQNSVETTHDVILSKFYYTLEVTTDTNAIIGIHQENKRSLGADWRPNIDQNFVILQRDDDGDLNLIDYVDYSISKTVQKEVYLAAGNYIIVPGSLGGYL